MSENSLGSVTVQTWTTTALAMVGAVPVMGTVVLARRVRRLTVQLEASKRSQAAMEARSSQTRRDALDLHDIVVQELVTAQMGLELGQVDMGMAALSRALETSKAIITDLLDDPALSAATTTPGGLRLEAHAKA